MDNSEAARVAFDAFQATAAGGQHLNRHGFKCAVLAATGWKPTSSDLEQLLGQPVPGDALLTYEHLHRVVKIVVSSRDPTARLREMYQAFDAAGLGFIRREEALRIFQEAAPTVRSSTVEEVFDALDTHRSGRVSCDAFMSALRDRLV
ncbi:EF-hand calcium-binding domain-containing protein 11 [Pleodorina starrii]|nr:EF-hand calcium-binding domain-containing protein 11 [Pleodorina starrii]